MSDRIVMRVAESLVAGGPPGTAAEPEIIIGELDGPVGTAFATLLGDQVKGHSRVLAIMNTDIMVKPATLMVSKVTVKDTKYTNILMGTVQGAIANGVFLASVNRVGKEDDLTFWGRSFVCDPFGEIIAQASHNTSESIVVECDLNKIEKTRQDWPFLRDRRVDAYQKITQIYHDPTS